MTDTPDQPPESLERPAAGTVPPRDPTAAEAAESRAVWARGGWMLVLLILFSIAQSLLVATAILQFGWMLFTKAKNPHISDFGARLGNWMAINARYQAVASDEKPFPWSEWK
ncbi:DUF4389 domain-containing protein [Rhodovulum euryhalinum]|uniref:Uncharacterized protein DUF4389 n=1 Tax=Rhodovulum euryhalinum TaxID=35805 RepID=A0A4R2KFS8_9RHOB|nr:DUF4389 domain-containing protein [Rhodovulum euryhalinum]TCO71924.1 uncharacterized protein DUF4389 [Rhodovulum euryhalinum]